MSASGRKAPRPRTAAGAASAEAPQAAVAAVAAAAPPAPPALSSPTATPRRRKLRGNSDKHEDKLTLILTTAANLFAEHGYERTSLEAIAERLDMHKATLFHYVRGKEEILYLCQARSFANLEEVTAAVRDTTRPVLERLRLFVLHLAHAQHTVFGRCLVLVGPQPLAEAAGGEIRKIQRQLDTIVRDLLKEGIASGELKPVDPALAGAMLFGAMNWVPRWYRAEGRYSVDDIANAYFDLFADGVRAGGSAAGTTTAAASVAAPASKPAPAIAPTRARAPAPRRPRGS